MNRKLEIVSDTLISIAKLLFIYYIISLFGIIRAFAITYLYYKLTEFLLKKYFNLEKVESKDRLFLGKEIWERYNVVIILKMKDFSEDKMKDFLIERVIKKFPKFNYFHFVIYKLYLNSGQTKQSSIFVLSLCCPC